LSTHPLDRPVEFEAWAHGARPSSHRLFGRHVIFAGERSVAQAAQNDLLFVDDETRCPASGGDTSLDIAEPLFEAAGGDIAT
jgi:hypothetical protein